MDIGSDFRDAGLKLDGGALVVRLRAELQHQQGETLADVVMKLSGDSRAFMFPGVDQLAVHRGKRVARLHARLFAQGPSVLLFRSFTLRDDGRQRKPGNREDDEKDVEEHRVDERRVSRKRSKTKRGQYRRQRSG